MDNSKKWEHSYYRSLQIENFGCFKERQKLYLSFGNGAYSNFSNWNLILGDNGTGKTTLLKILDRFQPFEWNINGGNKVYIPIDAGSKNQVNLGIKWASLFVSSIKEGQTVHIGKDWGVYNEANTNIFLISYGASRRMSKKNNLINESLEMTSSLFDEGIELINAEEWYFQKYLNEQNSEKSVALIFAKQLKIIKKLLIDFLPDISDLRPKAISDVKGTSSLEVKLESGEWIPLRDLSYGYQTMTALLVDIGSRMMDKYPESDNPLAEPVIILIDEIDLHLHPKWQRQIMEQFSKYFPKAQFIVTSHSPLIVQAAEAVNANIVVCRKDGDKVIIDNNPEEVKGWRIDQILISDLFDLPTVRSNADEEKMSRYYELEAKSERTIQEESELEDIQKDIKKSFESDKPFSETERKINQFLETHLK